MNELEHPEPEEELGITQLRMQSRRSYAIFGWALVVLLLSELVFPVFVVILLGWLSPWIVLDMNQTLFITYGSMYLMGLPLAWLMISELPNRMPARPYQADERLGAGQLFSLFTILFALSSMIVLAAGFCAEVFGIELKEPLENLTSDAANPVLVFILAVVVAPVMEEIIFRWLPYRKLSGYGMRHYVIWTALAFGLFHLNVMQGLYAAAMGIVFALVMYRTGSAKYSILLHFLVNLTSGLGLGGFLMDVGGMAATLYGLCNLIIFAIGIVMLIRYIRSGFFSFRTPFETVESASWRNTIFTVGYLFFVLLCLLTIIYFA